MLSIPEKEMYTETIKIIKMTLVELEKNGTEGEICELVTKKAKFQNIGSSLPFVP